MNKAAPISAFESPLATTLINFGNVPHLLVRRVACRSGSVEVNISYAPRPPRLPVRHRGVRRWAGVQGRALEIPLGGDDIPAAWPLSTVT
jgi:hypothetical protein